MKVTMEFNREKAEKIVAMAMDVSRKVTRTMSDEELVNRAFRYAAVYGFDNMKIEEEDHTMNSNYIPLNEINYEFSDKAKAAWKYFDGDEPNGAAFTYYVNGYYVITDEVKKFCCERGTFDSPEAIESWLEAVYKDLLEDGMIQ